MKKLICVQYVQTLIGPQSKYHIKRLLIFTFFVCFFLCSAISMRVKGENELAKDEIRMIENSKTWTHVFQQYSNQAIPINIAPESEDVLTIANIVVKSLHQDNYDKFSPF